jgi:hypothetical protein
MTVWVPLSMPRIRPQQPVLSGLGVAGAVLAAVVVTFALASGIISYSLTAQEPLVPSSAALVLDPVSATALTRAPLVLPRSRGAATGRISARAAGVPAGARGAGASGSLAPSRAGRILGIQTPGGTQGSTTAGNPAAQPGTGTGRRPVGAALGDTTEAVGATTGSLGRGLHATAVQLKTGTHEIVRTAVGRVGAALAKLVGPQS